jgi:hypothetical protein
VAALKVNLVPFPKALLEPRNPLRAIAVGWLTAFVPAIAISAVLAVLLPQARTPQFPFSGEVALLLLVVFAPVVETLVMGTILLILLRFVGKGAAIAISAVGWGVAHSLEVPIWGLVIWWPFLIFSTLFVVWRERSVLAAFAMAALVHGLNNLLPALPVAYPDLLGS